MSSNGLEYGYGIDGTTTNAGSSTNPYAINDLADLQAISSSNWGTGVYYQQTEDITLTSSCSFSGFIGHYNGDGYSIDGDSEYSLVFKSPKDSAGTYVVNSTVERCVLKNLIGGHIMHGGLIKNCIINNATFSGNSQISIAYMEYNSAQWGGYLSSATENCIAVGCSMTSTYGYSDARYPAVFVGSASDSLDTAHSYAKNCVAIDSTAQTTYTTYGSMGVQIGYSGGVSLTNNYSTAGGSSTTDSNGMLISGTLYNNSDFWFNNAGGSLSQVYLNYDTDVWEWDDDTSLPKLKHTSRPPTVTLYSGGSWITGTVKVYSNNQWVDATQIKVWNGSEWKESQ